MNICIHRGAHQIGGTCIELESQGHYLILDIGLPLDAPDPTKVPLPPLKSLTSPLESAPRQSSLTEPESSSPPHNNVAGILDGGLPSEALAKEGIPRRRIRTALLRASVPSSEAGG